MRIFSKGTLRSFWEECPDAQSALEFWYDTVENIDFENPNEVIAHFKNADTVGNGRIVFKHRQKQISLDRKIPNMKRDLFLCGSLERIRSMIK